MTSNIGGLHSKLGNRYEAKWLVLKLLEVLAGRARSLKVEGIGPEFAGFEAAVEHDDHVAWHQTKINAPNGNWTLRALEREGVIAAFKRRLEASPTDRCVFVSQARVVDLQHLPGKASRSNDEAEFRRSLNKDERAAVDELARPWDTDPATTREWLTRCSFKVANEEVIDRFTGNYLDFFVEEPSGAFAILRDHIEQSFNKTLTKEALRAAFRAGGGLNLKPEALDPTILERIKVETAAYLRTYIPFGAGNQTIERQQTTSVSDLLTRPEGPTIILLKGVAGSGKSAVVRGAIEHLEKAGIPTLAFRVDQHLDRSTTQELGSALTGRNESPVLTLVRLCRGGRSVLIVDQVDAVSEVSGRNGAVRETVLRLLGEADTFKSVRLLLVCRTFDLESDARLKTLQQAAQVGEVEVPLLDWSAEVEPFLTARGLVTTALTAGQKELLRLPINLALYLETCDGGQSFATRSDLFQRLLKKKERVIAQHRTLAWTASAALGEVVRWMSNRQRLDAPESVLDDFPHAVDVLASEHLIVDVRGNLNLFHESFFDFLFARHFVREERSLHDLLMSDEQHLFRRTQVRQVLEALRQADRARYLRELRELLGSTTVRYHIQNAIALWLSTLQDPTVDEFRIVDPLDTPGAQLPLLVRDALLGSTGWFDLLAADGWVERQLESGVDERCDSVLHRLDRLANQRPDQIAALLERWWRRDASRGRPLLRWMSFVTDAPGDGALERLCERVIHEVPIEDDWNPLGKSGLFLPNWVAKRRTDGATILRSLFDAWFKAHPGRHPFERDLARDIDSHWLGELATTSPLAFLEGAGPALVTALDMIEAKKATGEWDYSFDRLPRAGDVYGGNAFFALQRKALCRLAATEPNNARRMLEMFEPSRRLLFLHLHLETIAASGGALAQNLCGLLHLPNLSEAGWEHVPWLSLAKAAKASLPHLPADARAQLEFYVMVMKPELTAAIDLAHDIHQCGERDWRDRNYLMDLLKKSGHARWCVLKTIGPDLLSDRARAVLDEGSRKFRDAHVPEAGRIRGGWVHSPIPRERAALMPDDHWLGAMEEYDSGRKEGRRNFLAGGPAQLAGELQHLTTNDPRRFVDLIKRIPPAANPTYVDRILNGVAETSDVPLAAVRDAVWHAHGRSPDQHASAIVRLFDRHPTLAEDGEMLDLLLGYARYGDAGQDTGSDITSTRDTIVTIEDLLDKGARLHVRGMNLPRGAAFEALGNVLWEVPAAADKAWELLDERIEFEQAVSVRCCMPRPLIALFNADRQRCGALFERLPLAIVGDDNDAEDLDRGLAPLVTHEATQLMPYIVHQVPEAGRRIIDRLLASGNDTFRRIGAWHAIRAGFHDEAYASIADQLIHDSADVRRLAAAIAASAASHDEYRGRAEAWLKQFFDDPDQLVRQQAADVFRNIHSADFWRFVPLADAYLSSAAARDSCWSLLHALETAACDTQALVIKAAERLTDDLDERGNEAGRRMSELHTIQDLIRRDYAASDGNPALREKLLNVIDRVLSRGYYGVETIIKAHERS